uniref:Alpha-taxilin n=1 Tax=Globodera pallida TaxID=36090 RepID=A0A183BNG8_GLOPA
MDLAATSSAIALTECPALEKAREKQKRKIGDAISGLKAEDQLEFLISRLTEAELNGTEQKRELERFRRENGKLNTKLNSAEKLLSKTEVAKSKLEQLCRELSKTHREEKEQNQLRCKQMQNMHAETVESFKKSLSEIQQTVEEKQEHSKRVADVEKLSKHLNQLTSDYETRLTELKKLYEQREADLGVLAKAKDSELDVLHTQIGDTQKRVQQVFAENVMLKKELLVSEDRVKKSIESEIGMRKLLDEYSEKYSELTKSLSQSNSSFDKMNSKLIRMESESRKWKNKAEEAARVVTALRGEKAETEQNLSLKDRQLAQLQELCRALKKAGDEPKRWEGRSECEAEGTDIAGGDAGEIDLDAAHSVPIETALSTSRQDQMAA